jgi:hypothetical protein
MMLRCFLVIVLFGVVTGCTKKVDLPEITVSAADAGEFSRFRSELDTEFPGERLQAFDIAVQELKLDAMNRDIVSPEARERDMLAVVNGKSIHAVTLLGWEARHARFLREIADINRMLERDLKVRQNAGPNGPSTVVLARIQSAQNVIAKIQANAAATESRLAELRAVKGN